MTDEAPQTRQEVALYISDISSSLSRMARNVGLDSLAYILDMARMEAQAEAATNQPLD